MLGVGVAEQVGLISALIRKLMLGRSKAVITLMVIFVGLFSSLAADAGYLVVIPLGAAIFYAVGRHPLAGLTAAFFGVSAGYGANIVLTINDILLSSISQEAARIIDPLATVAPTSNYYFMVVSTVFLTGLGYFITEKIIIPRLGPYVPEGDVPDSGVSELSADEKRGLKFAAWSFVGSIAILLLLSLPSWAPLRNAETGSLVTNSPLMTGLVTIIMLLFLMPAIGYGIGTRSLRDDKSIVSAMTKSMQNMGAYLVLAFFAAQFIAYFNYSRLGIILSVNGAHFLQDIGFTGIPLIIAFILLTAFLNIFIGSASAKWVMMAPVFVPMFMQLGYDPSFTQLIYRVADPVTNIVSPLLPYFALIIVFAEKYDKKAGLGTIISLMIPYSIIAMITWSTLLIIWYLLGLPIGLGGNIYL
jgi:aminobenzoyl-glutamate transport protein